MHLVETENQSQRRVWFAYVVLVLCNIVDVVYTHIILTVDAEEANPIMYYLYHQTGILGIAAFKIIFLILLAFTVKHVPSLGWIYRCMFYVAVEVYVILALYHAYWMLGMYNLF